ncbi:uncharacterized protein LOC100194023 [Zea mays]|jgi:hypothetical protein|uniref:Uncharacterized protein n=1 Tax=Zea mays TaxID=4577 RepID=B4FH53_MAIZE|nr:uncharacterized protein LOC100194023 [Zea mays]ACF81446.1 unknown [Zea mays]|eukprot:NP_001132558.1 uncharacterized protein LOC100194023 [Zea mays]
MELACTCPPCSCRGAPSRAPSAMAASLAQTWLGLRPSVAASSPSPVSSCAREPLPPRVCSSELAATCRSSPGAPSHGHQAPQLLLSFPAPASLLGFRAARTNPCSPACSRFSHGVFPASPRRIFFQLAQVCCSSPMVVGRCCAASWCRDPPAVDVLYCAKLRSAVDACRLFDALRG